MIGINIFGLIDKAGKDLDGTFEALSQAGFDGVELFVLPTKKQKRLPPAISSEQYYAKMVDTVRKHHMHVPSVHMYCAVGNIMFPKSWVLRAIRKLNTEFGIDTFVFSGMFTDARGAKRWAKYLRNIAESVQLMNCKVLYHNHSQEFTPVEVEGKRMSALDYFFSLAGEQVLLQLDIGWAGICDDKVKLAQKYQKRIASIHLKDFIPGTRGNFDNSNMPKERFAAIGDGEICTAQVLRMKDTFPHFNGSIIIDQDHSAGDILEDACKGYRNVMEMLDK